MKIKKTNFKDLLIIENQKYTDPRGEFRELLIEKDYEVHGTIRRSSSINTEKIDHLIAQYQGNKLFLYYSDLLDSELSEYKLRILASLLSII